MAEVFDPPDLSIPDRPELKEVDDYRDTALAPPPALPREKENAPIWCVNHFEHLLHKVNPPFAVLLTECDEVRCAPEILWEIGILLPVAPVQFDLRIESLYIGFADSSSRMML